MKKYYDITNCLEYLERAARTHPDKIAFADQSEALTFKELMDISQAIGSALKGFELNKAPVAILMDARSISYLKATMGILYAGCFYIPLDPASPEERIRTILTKLEPALIIYDKKAENIKEALDKEYSFVPYSSLLSSPADMEYLNSIREKSNYYDLLFIMYTSGSTGIPKGVVHTHKDLIRYTEFTLKRYSFTDTTVFANQSPFYYANSILDIYPPIAAASTVHIFPASMLSFPKKMISALRDLKITEICMTPSSFNAIAEAGVLEPDCLPDLEYILPSGEIANSKFMKAWTRAASAKGHFWNFYGSTELLSVALWTVNRDFMPDEIIPSGPPYRSAHVLIMDEDGRECLPGLTGEMYIHNEWMFSGYYKDPERNRDCLVKDPLGLGINETFFRTGDMGYINEYGELVVVGRKDTMIKHKGYRMELGEVEYATNAIEHVGSCCCILDRETEEGDTFLFYTGSCSEKEVRTKLKCKLPKYAMPDHIIHLDQIPMNSNMKADRLQLSKMLANYKVNKLCK